MNTYIYSSAAFYCLGRNDGLTVEDPLFSTFGENITERRIAYRDFLKNFDAEEEKHFAQLEQPVGDKEFLRQLIILNGRYIPRRKGRAAAKKEIFGG